MSKSDESKYYHIVAWGHLMGSTPEYIEWEQHRAFSDGAPIDAIYKGGDGRWHTVDDIVYDDRRTEINEAAMELKRHAEQD